MKHVRNCQLYFINLFPLEIISRSTSIVLVYRRLFNQLFQVEMATCSLSFIKVHSK